MYLGVKMRCINTLPFLSFYFIVRVLIAMCNNLCDIPEAHAVFVHLL